MTKKINFVFAFWIIFLFFSVIPNLIFVQATCPTTGLVPCGTNGCPCQICHFFVLINNIVGFVLKYLVTATAVLLFAIGGAMFVFAGGNPQTIEQAKTILSRTVFGLLIVYGAFIFIGMLMSSLGLSAFSLDFTGPDKWNIITCP